MDVKIIDEVKNKRGKLLNKVVRITNKNAEKGLTFNDINTFYSELKKKYKPDDIKIIGRTFDSRFNKFGKETSHIVLKSKNYSGDNLKFDDEEYQSNQPKEVMDKILNNYYSIDVLIDF